jgi:hypothetical protein
VTFRALGRNHVASKSLVTFATLGFN